MGAARSMIADLHGAWLVLIGVMIISPDALLVRMIKTDDITTAFWRLFLLGATLMLIALWRGMQRRQSIRDALMPTRDEMLAGLFYGGTSACFILSIRNTDAANTLVIIAATPLLAALIAVFVFKRVLPARTWLASVVVFVALATIVGAGFGGANMLGDLLALATAICMACYFNVVGARNHIDAVRAMMIGAFLSTLVMVPGASPMMLEPLDPIWLILLGCVVLPGAFLFITAGAKKIPAAEAGLIMLNEAIFGSFLVWLIIDEVPGKTTLICGTIVIATLVAHSYLGMREARRKRVKVAA
ncbi:MULTISPECIES: DMT family transporter [Thalassospira]|uniref:Membrane protein n=2 Tax=Thalassospira TaxID=168934 RepID=A0A367W721_9PROT|nr:MULTISPECIES: DMT family transporter [Thalassospira]MDG4719261.1 DMT family transporter [Thalassospira sp. FZY0004]RCK37177.1 membrane protein [Thalassospira profundimaris]